MPRRRSKLSPPKTENIIESADYYIGQIIRLFPHDPQRIFDKIERLDACMLYVKDHFTDAEREKQLNAMMQQKHGL